MVIVFKYGTRVNLKYERYREEGRTASSNRLIYRFQLASLKRINSQSMIKFKIQYIHILRLRHHLPRFFHPLPTLSEGSPPSVYMNYANRLAKQLRSKEYGSINWFLSLVRGQEPGRPWYLNGRRNSPTNALFRNAILDNQRGKQEGAANETKVKEIGRAHV